MSRVHGGPSTTDGPPKSPVPSATGSVTPAGVASVPIHADGVQLLGETHGSGYKEPPSLVRRADGQTIQLTTLLYLVLEAIDGRRTMEQIAEHASTASGRLISAENVQTLIQSQLLPLGLLQLADGSQPQLKRSDPLLGMRFRYTVTDPERTRKLTSPFAALFNPVLVVAVTAAFLAACWWVLMVKGLASATHEAFANPGLLLLVFAVTILSAGFHEFGHAAAARRGGATPGAMGAGLYLIWPAFYTDVTDSYRLNRAGRLRTDIGGLYFNAIVAVAVMGTWWITGFDALLLLVVTQILQMVRQLLPLVRFDGYHILADATGVPDLFQHIRPTLLGLLPWRRRDAESQVLKPWARTVVSVWVLVTVPLLLVSVVMLVLSLPRLLGTAWASAQEHSEVLAQGAAEGDFLAAAARALAIAVVALPVLGILYLLLRLARQLLTFLWHKTRGNALKRGIAMVLVAGAVAGLGWAWWPDGDSYRPVQPYERGTLADAVSAIRPLSAVGQAPLREGAGGQMTALLPEGTNVPTREQPLLSMVLVPRQEAKAAESGTGAGESSQAAPAPSWVFPFDKPLPPEEDGNQALAVNTTDGSVAYDVAFALVWAEDGPVDTRNEAYAFANCTDCAAVAVGFQVVLIVGQADVVVPENLSAAANYNCVRCLTYALASQLVLTLDGPLSEDGMARLAGLWQEIAEFGRNLQNVPLSEIQDRLNDYKAQITEIIRTDPSATADTGTGTESSTAPGTPSPDPAATSSPGSDATAPAATAPAATAPAPTAPAGTAPAAPAPGEPEPVAPAPAPTAPLQEETAPAEAPLEPAPAPATAEATAPAAP